MFTSESEAKSNQEISYIFQIRLCIDKKIGLGVAPSWLMLAEIFWKSIYNFALIYKVKPSNFLMKFFLISIKPQNNTNKRPHVSATRAGICGLF